MASAVLSSRNEPYWGEGKVYMRKYANSSSSKPYFNKFNPTSNPNPNVNSNPSPSHVPGRQIHDTSKAHAWQNDEPSSRAAPAATAASDDSSSLNRKPNDLNNHMESSHREYLTFNLAAYSRAELKDLKRRLCSELEQVRILRAQIEDREVEYRSGYIGSQSVSHGGRDVKSVPPPPLQLDFSSEPSRAASSKEKRTPKTNRHYPLAELVTGRIKAAAPSNNKKASGQKRALPFVSGREPKRHAASDSQIGKLVSAMMRRCQQILVKLMKHKHGWVFNTPVDAVSLGLHDYHQVIKHPMDLGTVKSRLNNKEYGSPLDFASDVRLTFNNAMKYNSKGQDVYIMAETLLTLFEDMFKPAYKKFEAEHERVLAAEEVNRRLWAPVQEPVQMVDNASGPWAEAMEIAKKPDSMRVQETLSNKPSAPVESFSAPMSVPAGTSSRPVVMQRSAPKLPKPKAKDPNKRLMSFEEKAKLGLNLQNLPSEKMDPMLQIIRKRNSHMAPEGDEIELDIEALDNETLWELDRFVGNHKKAESKMKRQGLINNTILETQINKVNGGVLNVMS
ncbi:hypothetical protein U1Q18_012052 [Sarracenia purpurea var. burkii]